MLRRPEILWPVDKDYEADYQAAVAAGRAAAAGQDACIVAIGRNAMPLLTNTLALVDEVQAGFRSCRMYVWENDSIDGTDATLDEFAATRPWATIEHGVLGGIDSRGFEKERTERLALCRNKCLEWVRREAADTTWTIVLDLDPEGGFSVDGVFNSIGRMAASANAGAMASYSLWVTAGEDGDTRIAQYDSWAARLNWWNDRKHLTGMGWFSMLLPPVGSMPFPMNSAFGGLCVYRTPAFLSGGYSGEDCEHVPHHRRMADAGWQLYLNPGCRYVAIWRPKP